MIWKNYLDCQYKNCHRIYKIYFKKNINKESNLRINNQHDTPIFNFNLVFLHLKRINI